MYLIKNCPSCNKKIRFPIDKGKIQVKCSCGYSFAADPDNPELYKNASFDIYHKSDKGRNRFSILNIFKPSIISRSVNRIISLKYKLQNFKLLPSAEQNRIITIIGIIIIILFILIIVYFFFPSKQKLPDEEGIAMRIMRIPDHADCSSSFLF